MKAGIDVFSMAYTFYRQKARNPAGDDVPTAHRLITQTLHQLGNLIHTLMERFATPNGAVNLTQFTFIVGEWGPDVDTFFRQEVVIGDPVQEHPQFPLDDLHAGELASQQRKTLAHIEPHTQTRQLDGASASAVRAWTAACQNVLTAVQVGLVMSVWHLLVFLVVVIGSVIHLNVLVIEVIGLIPGSW